MRLGAGVRPLGRTARGWLAGAALISLAACGAVETGPAAASDDTDAPTRSVATGQEQFQHIVLTEADAGRTIEAEYYNYDIGLPDKKGLEIELSGDDASSLRWRFAEKPDPLIMEWYGVDGQLAFETDGLIGNPATAAKVLEFRGTTEGETRVVLELVERDSTKRAGEPATRLEYTFRVPVPQFRRGIDVPW